jgi:hypothetical protein
MRSKSAIGILIAALSILSRIQRSPHLHYRPQLPCAGPESGHRDRR